MQSSFIGIFDSGVGGLAVHRAARELLPHQAFIYVADSGFAPYGDREPAYIAHRVAAIADALVERGAQALVIACNTATVTAVAALRAKHPIPIVGIEPAIKPAAALSRGGRVIVLATQRTTQSEAVARLCVRYGAGAQIILQACPGLADLVEAGHIDGEAVTNLLKRYLTPVAARAGDVIVLGCTHFTFLADRIRGLVGPDVVLIEPSAAVARQLARQLPADPVPAHSGPASETFYTTAATPPAIGAVMSKLLGRRVEALAAHGLGLAMR
ncbi:glutamate racemase [Methylomagnum ishizawai]|uniref:Glutamate racemase n=1 Tax=Methylomagnum ishizawai TaxID=1760988 RepID=A0A1Y6D4A0_9GAMM|nr:glutamate racemase [Methylomagnum ishizawai]SMF95214.1 glutamate racemase [Methylomagnum ishizawai]